MSRLGLGVRSPSLSRCLCNLRGAHSLGALDGRRAHRVQLLLVRLGGGDDGSLRGLFRRGGFIPRGGDDLFSSFCRPSLRSIGDGARVFGRRLRLFHRGGRSLRDLVNLALEHLESPDDAVLFILDFRVPSLARGVPPLVQGDEPRLRRRQLTLESRGVLLGGRVARVLPRLGALVSRLLLGVQLRSELLVSRFEALDRLTSRPSRPGRDVGPRLLGLLDGLGLDPSRPCRRGARGQARRRVPRGGAGSGRGIARREWRRRGFRGRRIVLRPAAAQPRRHRRHRRRRRRGHYRRDELGGLAFFLRDGDPRSALRGGSGDEALGAFLFGSERGDLRAQILHLVLGLRLPPLRRRLLRLAHELLLAPGAFLPLEFEPRSLRLQFLHRVLREFFGVGVVSLGGLEPLRQFLHPRLRVGGGATGLVERDGELLGIPVRLGGGGARGVQFLSRFLGFDLDSLRRRVPLRHRVVPRRLHHGRASLRGLEPRGE